MTATVIATAKPDTITIVATRQRSRNRIDR
jgi:hypothetical protein